MKSSPVKRRGLLPTAGSILLVASFALLAMHCDTLVPRQGWSEKWGPMVPHKSFPGDCSICHVTERWDVLRQDIVFDHEKEAGHALEGAHEQAACLRCHNDRGPVGVYVERGCGGCHVDPHKATLGLECTLCHDQHTWQPAGIVADHILTRFPMVGVHAVTPCESCHLRAAVGDFKGAPTDCALCHQRDLVRTSSPDHTAVGWVTDCERCHTPLGWQEARIDHDFFPLVGGHSGLDCAQCHTNRVFSGTSSDCFSCHQDEYQRAPDHVSQQFSTDCAQCHSVFRWEDAIANHDFFPLTGGHGFLECTQCHTTGRFGPIPSDCYACHQDDYQRAANHAARQYPTDCAACHNTTAWVPSSFNHRFSLRGPHSETCSTCHQGGNTATFTCLVCHEHSQAKMDDKHKEVTGYSYDSQACYQCHPDG